MNCIAVNAFAKINFSLDITGKRADGYHLIRSVMQAVELSDRVYVSSDELYAGDHLYSGGEAALISRPGSKITIEIEDAGVLRGMKLPVDYRNTAYKAASEMGVQYSVSRPVHIHIRKNIPAEAGLAGGSADAAAVILALNALWGLKADLRELMELGLRIGADVPFCIAVTAKHNPKLGFAHASLATSAALAEGIGERLSPIPSVGGAVVLAKPAAGVSTAKIYELYDEMSGRATNFAQPRITLPAGGSNAAGGFPSAGGSPGTGRLPGVDGSPGTGGTSGDFSAQLMHVKATDVAAPDRVAPDSRHMFDCEDSLTRTIFAGAGDSFDVEREHPGAGAPVDVIRKPTRNRAAAKPDTDVLIRLIKNREAVHFWAGECARYMVNVLEPVTSSEVPAVAHTLRVVREGAGADHVMMSGSGPTVFAWYAEPESGAGERNFLSLINALGKGYDVIFANLL